VLAAGLLAVAGLAFVGASRVGDDIDRLELAESLSFQLKARVFEQAVLESKAVTSGVPDDSGRQRAATLRREITSALAELTSLLPDDRNATATAAAAADWQAALDTKLALLAAGDLVAANRVDRAQVEPHFELLADRLRTTCSGGSSGPGPGSAPPRPGPARSAAGWSTRSSRWPSASAAAWPPSSTTGRSRP
jgi:hypothetical protein